LKTLSAKILKRLEVQKLVYGGDALAREVAATRADEPASGEPDRRKAIFVPFAIPGEQVEATIIEEKRGYSRARFESVIEASPDRAEPACPYYGKCGGCHYQHMDYAAQLQAKAEILRETLRRTARIEAPAEITTHASPPLGYRNRTRMHVQATPFALGYYRLNSHSLLPVEQCPISSPLINRAIEAVWTVGRQGGAPVGITEIEFFADADDAKLLIELYVRPESDQAALEAFARNLQAALPAIAGVCALTHSDRGRPEALRTLAGEPKLFYRAGAREYQVSAGAFFQTNRFLADKLIELVTAGRSGRLALDLYAGVGLFAGAMAGGFDRVVAVESAPASGADLEHNVPINVKVSKQTTEAYLQSAAGQLKPDLLVVDPPRAGLGESVAGMLAKVPAAEFVYVSCDPATLARDLAVLAGGGYSIAAMHVVDLFPQTFHIESVTVLRQTR
jgi:23S rRNA (uracil1939-C5)-methyltransferase